MNPGTYRLRTKQGVALRLPVRWKDKGTGLPYDLTGYTARFVARYRNGSQATRLDLSTANGGVTIDGPAGTVLVSASREAMAAIKPHRYVFDLVLTSGGGLDYPLLTGPMEHEGGAL